MQELIKITRARINNETVNAVNARDLWKKLEVTTRFNDWMPRRIEEYGFEENRDFTVLKNEHGRNISGKFISNKEYLISLDMAKELAMVENNEQGRKIRRYFIEVEREFRNDGGNTEKLLEVIRRQERELFALEKENQAFRELLPDCEPGDISDITGRPRHYLRRIAATSKPTRRSFHKLNAALEAAEQVLPGFTDALADGRIQAFTILP
ncbi:antA/AntB antirepressor family protein [Victivallis vadensis]|uniref:antA/AntB antirepressor family protein n=1 Tax=Victivallis vadensis TaxID=172901 RepID=UPI0025967FFD|nr:antA/AntB antirepressor family protein [uncultured Victivallis sp.]